MGVATLMVACGLALAAAPIAGIQQPKHPGMPKIVEEPSGPPKHMVRTAEAAIVEARRAFDSQLLDYTTARFRDVRVRIAPNGDATLCGEVNSRNQFGAYVGWRRFAWLLGDTVFLDEPDKVPLTDVLCKQQPIGPDLSTRLTFRP